MFTMRWLTCSVALAFLSGFAACTGGSLDLGSSDASAPAQSDAGGGGGTTRWTGYLENYKLPSGSDAISLEVTSGDAAELNGTVVFGSGVLPPATDPNVGYPPGHVGLVGQPYAGEGFAYHLRSGKVAGSRLTFELADNELWGVWCTLQTSYEVDPGLYGCSPNFGNGSSNGECFLTIDGGRVPIDCGKMSLCQMVDQPCKCTASGCAANLRSTLSFDLVVAGDAANGTVVGLPRVDRVAVHLTRAR